ncbi:hypothetical protein AURDEDRAFT_114056 [Auricularia subglabra TFB-10046 SS5]|nr:hypothetical protein AURDEDRAFT_114056 [Auricularia subglabra TFB-10046 SS5]
MGTCLSYLNCTKPSENPKPEPAAASAGKARALADAPAAESSNPTSITPTEKVNATQAPGPTLAPPTGGAPAADASGPAGEGPGDSEAIQPPLHSLGEAGVAETTTVVGPERKNTIEIVIDPEEEPLGRGQHTTSSHSTPRPTTGPPARPPNTGVRGRPKRDEGAEEALL